MVDVKSNLARQLSGPLISTVVDGVSYQINRMVPYLNYLKSISLDTALDTDLETIGFIIGFIRPLVPNEVILEKLFKFSNYLVAPSFSETGFGAVDGSIQGGNFSELGEVLDTNKLPLTQYRFLLKAVARLKWNKLSLVSVDKVCKLFHTDYDITFLTSHDILIVFKDSVTGTKISLTNLYTANLVFEVIFNVTPRITCARL